MRLCMFDLDGTLGHLRGGGGEDGNFELAIREILGEIEVDTDWDTYEHVSDYGIVEGLYREHRGRMPTEDEHQAICTAFLTRIRNEVTESLTHFELVAGSPSTVHELPGRGWEVALATGGWRRTALYKLEVGGISFEGRAQAFAEDGPGRASILRAALERAHTLNGGAFERVVYIGDAVWDVRTCAALGWPFIGIAGGARAERLRALGTSHVLLDLSDRDAFVAALDEARVPPPLS